MITVIKKHSQTFIDALVAKGFSYQECPCCEIQPEWEHLPVIKAIREVELETGIQYYIN